MKLTFNIEGTDDERDSVMLHIQGPDWHLAMWNLDQWLRNQEKHAGVEMITIEEVRGQIRTFLSDYNLEL